MDWGLGCCAGGGRSGSGVERVTLGPGNDSRVEGVCPGGRNSGDWGMSLGRENEDEGVSWMLRSGTVTDTGIWE